jgi:hypothetical protein
VKQLALIQLLIGSGSTLRMTSATTSPAGKVAVTAIGMDTSRSDTAGLPGWYCAL